jgi:hypothetical protein
VSPPHILSGGDTRNALVTTLGSDFQNAVAPFKAEILDDAQYLRGDLHRAAMRLLVERHGRRPSVMEQQLIIAALADLQGERCPAAALDRAAARFAAPSADRRQLPALQQH